MGFIPSSSTIQLYAYFTQYAREKIANSNKNDVKVSHFSLHDDDVNYSLSKLLVNGSYNKLPTGFVPDITGDADTCIKSVAVGINKDYLNSNIITGSPTQYVPSTPPTSPPPPPPPSGARTLTVGFDRSRYDNPNRLIGKSDSDTFFIYLKQPAGDSNNPSTAEVDATQINITIDSYSSDYIDQPLISPASPVYFNSNVDGAGNKQFSFNFQKKGGLPPQVQTLQIVFRVTALSANRTTEFGFETFTYTQQIVWS